MAARSSLVLALALAAGCFHPARNAPEPNQNVITEVEIRATQAASIYDVIAELRPEYLRDRGVVSVLVGARDVATVFLNSEPYGSIASMRDLAAADFSEVRYFSGPDAVIKFGRSYGSGVIQLISRID